MTLVISTEHRFLRADGGEVYSTTHGRDYAFWSRYLKCFDGLVVVARVSRGSPATGELNRADGDSVTFCDLPDFRGVKEYLRVHRKLRQQIRQELKQQEAVICRVPSQIGTLVWKAIRHQKRPFGLEVVGDPWDMFSAGSYPSMLRSCIRRLTTRSLRMQCEEAAAVAYVTGTTLQRRYPPGNWSTSYSSIMLHEDAFISQQELEGRIRKWKQKKATQNAPWRVIFVGTLEQLYKGPQILIQALGACLEQGMDIELAVVGDGRYRNDLEELTQRQGVGERIHFLGRVPAGVPVREQLDRADLFVLPSYAEGLPRAMIEAMARGLACIGSTAGGIPELLHSDDMVRAGDAEALAAKIAEVLSSPERLEAMARSNLEKAEEYRNEVLDTRRVAFYSQVRIASERWLSSRG